MVGACVSYSASNTIQYAISASSTFAGSSWLADNNRSICNLSSTSPIYLKFRSPDGGESQVYIISGAAKNSQAASGVRFLRDLKLGARHSDVKALQAFLNSQGFIIAAKGYGSPGQESNYFGAATKKALINFQRAMGIKPASGYFGILTRQYINSLK